MTELPDDDLQASDSPTADGSVRIRLQKVLASAGFGSRRRCEDLITQGRVEVERRMVNELGATVDPDAQEIRVDGEKIHVAKMAYYLVNKPVGYLSTNFDPAGRPRVVDLLPPTKERLFTVGRLDMSSDGLMLVTNDGAIAQQLTHPRYGVEKTYLVQVAGNPTQDVLDKLVRGVHLAEGVARCVRVTVRSEIKHSTQLEIVLAEGKNREIRRILARVGHKVMTLRRIAIGGLKLKDLKPGEFRRVHPSEIKLLTQQAPPAKLRRRKRRTFHEPDGEQTGTSGKRPRPAGSSAAVNCAAHAPVPAASLVAVPVANKLADPAVAPQVSLPANRLASDRSDVPWAERMPSRAANPSQAANPGRAANRRVVPPASQVASRRTSPAIPARGVDPSVRPATRTGHLRNRHTTPVTRDVRKALDRNDHAAFRRRLPIRNRLHLGQRSALRDTYRLRIEVPELARRIVPGQFVMVRLAGLNDPLLGRPLALYDTVLNSSGEPSGIEVVYRVMGKMTARLAQYVAGQSVEVWGPLGNAFAPAATEQLIMVAGGIGHTPFLALAKEFLGVRGYGSRRVESAGRVTLCYGERSAEYFAGLDSFRATGVDLRVSTDDGSLGHHGRVTDLMRQVLDENGNRGRVVCCGPEVMMAAVARLAAERGVACQVSLETPMACGLGICFSCVAKVRQPDGSWDFKRTCVEGPIFEAEMVEF